MKRPSWWLCNLIAIDQLLNTLLWGWPDETLSSRAYRMDGKKTRWTVARRGIDLIFFWEPNHCYNSYIMEVEMKHHPLEVRNNE